MTSTKLLLSCSCAVMLLAGVQNLSASTNFVAAKEKATKEAADSTSKKTNYDKLFSKEHQIAEGLIKLHLNKGKVYFELPLSLLDREMLLGSTITETSDNGHAIVGSKPTVPIHFKFTMQNEKVSLREIKSNVITDDPTSGVASAIKLSNIGAITKNFKIEAYSPDSSAVVIDMTDFFVSDNPKMLPFDDFSYYTLYGLERNQSFKKDRSFVKDIKAFSDNVTVASTLSYEYSLTDRRGKKRASNAAFTATVTRSIMLLSEKPYRPRIADSRMSVFPTEKIMLEGNGTGVKRAYFSNRWNLEPSDSAAYLRGELVEPVKPIVFYIDPDFPETWKAPIKEGVNQWNEMFETVGFKNAIMAKDFPTPDEDPEFDPDNIKYSCIRYAPVSIENAMGPSWVDPRSGEILTASVYVYHDIAKLIRNWMFVQISPANPALRHTQLPDDMFYEGLRYVLSHEVGHCLGFMHNMSASSNIPVDSLRSPSFTQKYGTTTSIMDYARFNYVAQPGDYERGVKLTPPRFGEYDKYAVKWLYTAFPDKTEAEEQALLMQWLQDASKDPMYGYGKQLGAVLDPRAQTEDLGDDAIKASEYGIANLKYVVANLNSWIEAEDPDFEFRSEIFDEILSQYLRYINHIYANIGGIYLKDIKQGDEGDAFWTIPVEKQRAAFEFICGQLGQIDWLDNPELMKKIPLMGSVSATIEKSLCNAIVNAPQKVRGFGMIGEENYRFDDCAQDLFDFVWKPTKQHKQLSSTQKYLQELYVKQLISNSGIDRKASAQPKGIASVEEVGCLEPVTTELSAYTVEMPVELGIEPKLHESSPVLGYSGLRTIFLSINDNSAASSYGYLLRSYEVLKKASGKDKSHYQYLAKYIANTLESK